MTKPEVIKSTDIIFDDEFTSFHRGEEEEVDERALMDEDAWQDSWSLPPQVGFAEHFRAGSKAQSIISESSDSE